MDVGKSQSVPPFKFFRHCDICSEIKNFSPLQFFDVLRQNGCWKTPKVFRHCETFFLKIFFSPKGPPFNFFDILQQIGCLKIPKGPPFQFSGIVRLFFRKFVFSPKGPPFNCDKNVDNFGSVPLLARQSVHFLFF